MDKKEDLLLKKKIMTVDLNAKLVTYGKKNFPVNFVSRLSIVLGNEAGLDFFFISAAWKNSDKFRIFFRGMRERDLFLDLFTAIMNPMLPS